MWKLLQHYSNMEPTSARKTRWDYCVSTWWDTELCVWFRHMALYTWLTLYNILADYSLQVFGHLIICVALSRFMQFQRTALHMACASGHVEVAATLLKRGANIDMEDVVRLVCPWSTWCVTEWCVWFRHMVLYTCMIDTACTTYCRWLQYSSQIVIDMLGITITNIKASCSGDVGFSLLTLHPLSLLQTVLKVTHLLLLYNTSLHQYLLLEALTCYMWADLRKGVTSRKTRFFASFELASIQRRLEPEINFSSWLVRISDLLLHKSNVWNCSKPLERNGKRLNGPV